MRLWCGSAVDNYQQLPRCKLTIDCLPCIINTHRLFFSFFDQYSNRLNDSL